MADPLVRFAGDDWTFAVQFQDVQGNPQAVPDGSTAWAELFVGGLGATYGAADGVALAVTDALLGLGVVTVPRALTDPLQPQTLGALAAADYPVRLRGGLAGPPRQTSFVEGVALVDWTTVDLDHPGLSRAIVALAGPQGVPGPPGTSDDSFINALIFG